MKIKHDFSNWEIGDWPDRLKAAMPKIGNGVVTLQFEVPGDESWSAICALASAIANEAIETFLTDLGESHFVKFTEDGLLLTGENLSQPILVPWSRIEAPDDAASIDALRRHAKQGLDWLDGLPSEDDR
jgi:hypothetical protein